MRGAPQPLQEIVRGVVEPMGYELVGVELLGGRTSGRLLRVYIDAAAGILLEDCEAVSRQLGGVLDVEDPIAGDYTLEVSSPGLDRPLFEPAHFARFAGHQAKVRLARPLDGRRNFKGLIVGMEGDVVRLEVDGAPVRVPFDAIDSAHLVAEL